MLAKDQTMILRDFADTRDLTLYEPRAGNGDDLFYHASLSSIRDHCRMLEGQHSKVTDQAFQVGVGFIESGLPNAIANKQGDQHIAMIHTGLASCIQEFSFFCLAQASVFSEIGRSDLEQSPAAGDSVPPGVALLLAGAWLIQDR